MATLGIILHKTRQHFSNLLNNDWLEALFAHFMQHFLSKHSLLFHRNVIKSKSTKLSWNLGSKKYAKTTRCLNVSERSEAKRVFCKEANHFWRESPQNLPQPLASLGDFCTVYFGNLTWPCNYISKLVSPSHLWKWLICFKHVLRILWY